MSDEWNRTAPWAYRFRSRAPITRPGGGYRGREQRACSAIHVAGQFRCGLDCQLLPYVVNFAVNFVDLNYSVNFAVSAIAQGAAAGRKLFSVFQYFGLVLGKGCRYRFPD